MKNKMGTNELTVHQRGVILRGICSGSALRGKSPEISEENTVIICQGELSMWDICRWVLSIPFFISCIRQQNPLTVLSKIILRKVKQFNLPPPKKNEGFLHF